MIIRGQCWVGNLKPKAKQADTGMQERFQQGENVLLPAVLDLLNLDLP